MKVDFSPGQMALVCVLDGSCEPFQARLLSFTGRYLSVAAEPRLVRGTPVRIEWAQYLLLAEVNTQTPEGVMELQIRHALHQKDVEHFRNVWL